MSAPLTTPPFQSEIESVARVLPAGQQEDFRRLMTGVMKNLQTLSPGGNLVRPGGTPAGANTPPSGGSLAVAGANGNYQLTIAAPTSAGQTSAVWHQIQYSPVTSFTTAVVTMPNSTASTITVPLPGAQYFFRIRFSFDQVTWSGWTLASVASVESGLLTSSATADATAFNQTNYTDVTSTAVGSTTEVQIQGPSGPLTGSVRQKGPTQQPLPGATIYGVTPGSKQFVAYDGEGYTLRPTLAGVLADDDLAPIGAVSVVGTGTPTLPVVTPVLGAGGAIVGLSWTPGAGLTAPPTFVVTDPGGPGTGATVICTGVEAGQMTGMQVTNSGADYDSHTLITPSGGISPGVPGGGTAVGGNGGRLTAV